MTDITVKPLRALADMRQIVDLQRTFWGDDSESVIPAHMLFSLANHGGHVLTAFDEDRAVGVLVGFLGTNMEDPRRPAMANLQIVSKRMVVLPDYRGGGVGYRLKLAQRDMAITQGVRLVVWTFDPLMALNAHLNIRKLGAMCPQYLPDYYGTGEAGGLATLGSSDRLAVEWWVTSRRVEERIYGKRGFLTLPQYLEGNAVILNPTRLTDDGVALPADRAVEPTGSLALVEIPPHFPAIVRDNPALARAWRAHTREVLRRLFAEGFMITDFVRDTYQGRERAFYLMSYNGPQFETFSVN